MRGVDGALAVAALEALPDHEALRQRRSEVLAEAVAVPLDVADTTVGRGLDQRIPRRAEEVRAGVQDDQAPAGAHHPCRLGEERGQVRQVGEGEAAQHVLDLSVGERHRGEVAAVEAGLRHGGAGAGEHALGEVDADHLVAAGDQLGGDRPGPAGGVEHGARGEIVEQRGEQVVPHREAAVVLAVVGRRPAVVPVAHRQRRDVDPVPELLGADQERPHLGEAGLGEGAVVLAGEGAHQGDALETEQVGERVLVDGAA